MAKWAYLSVSTGQWVDGYDFDRDLILAEDPKAWPEETYDYLSRYHDLRAEWLNERECLELDMDRVNHGLMILENKNYHSDEDTRNATAWRLKRAQINARLEELA